MIENVTVVIRNVGERTLDSCFKILSRQVNDKNIFVIREAPFSSAVIKTFEIGIDANKEWTLAVDADLLLTENAVEKMIAKARVLSNNLYVYQGMILDYLFGSYRFGGPHLYKTTVLPNALKIVKKNLSETRPESFTYRELAKKGFVAYCDNECYAVHDFEQYPKDYYRKAFFHGKKALDDQLVIMLRYWRKSVSRDLNYKLALHGLFDGLSYDDQIEVDINFFNNIQNKNKFITQLISKPLVELNLEENYVNNIIALHRANRPSIQPSSWQAYYMNVKGKQSIFPSKNLLLTVITKIFIYFGDLLLKQGLKMRQR